MDSRSRCLHRATCRRQHVRHPHHGLRLVQQEPGDRQALGAPGPRGNRHLNFSLTDRWPSPVEGAALEMPYSCKAVLGSNPNLSANLCRYAPAPPESLPTTSGPSDPATMQVSVNPTNKPCSTTPIIALRAAASAGASTTP